MSSITPANVHEVLNRWLLADGYPMVWDIEKSHGHYLHDSRSGREYLDFFCFFAARPLSFNHPGLKEPRFLETLTRVAQVKPSNCDLYTMEYARFIERFVTVPLGNHFRHMFVIEGGSPAVENALKTAMDWKTRKNIAKGKGERGSQIVHFKQCFHGRTGYALSLTDSPDPRKTQYFPKFPWPRITNPRMRFPFDAAAQLSVEEAEQKALAELDAAFAKNSDDIAAIIIEPIQGEGGDNYFRSEFLRALRKLCDEREAMLIFDEIQTGFGTTGAWWDWQHHDVKPDIMVFGKKTQVCGFACTERVDEIDGVFKVGSRISSTFEGNLTDMVRCTRLIEIIEEDRLVDNARSMGKYMQKVLADVASHHGEMSAVRGRGCWAAFDLPSTAERDKVVKAAFDEHLIVLPCGTQSIRLRPPLDVTADAIGRAAAQLEAALKRAYGRA